VRKKRRQKEAEETTGQKYNGPPALFHRAVITKNYFDLRAYRWFSKGHIATSVRRRDLV